MEECLGDLARSDLAQGDLAATSSGCTSVAVDSSLHPGVAANVPQAEPLMRTALTGSPTTVRTSRKTRPEIVAATGTLYGNRSTAEVAWASLASDAPFSPQLGRGIADLGSEPEASRTSTWAARCT